MNANHTTTAAQNARNAQTAAQLAKAARNARFVWSARHGVTRIDGTSPNVIMDCVRDLLEHTASELEVGDLESADASLLLAWEQLMYVLETIGRRPGSEKIRELKPALRQLAKAAVGLKVQG